MPLTSCSIRTKHNMTGSSHDATRDPEETQRSGKEAQDDAEVVKEQELLSQQRFEDELELDAQLFAQEDIMDIGRKEGGEEEGGGEEEEEGPYEEPEDPFPGMSGRRRPTEEEVDPNYIPDDEVGL